MPKDSYKKYLYIGLIAAGVAFVGTKTVLAQSQNAVNLAEKITSEKNGWSFFEISLDPKVDLDGSEISFYNHDLLRSYYVEGGGKLIWNISRGRNSTGEALLSLLKDSWTHGLNPDHYHIDMIRQGLENPYQTDLMQLEVIMSDAAVRYGRDVSGMRVDPSAIRQKPEYWRETKSPDAILHSLAEARNPVKALEKMAPQNGLYNRLRQELQTLSLEKGEHDHLLPLRFGNQILHPGAHHKDFSKLRAILGLPADVTYPSHYDDDLAASVIQFQKDNGLAADGVIGPQTLAAINRTNRDKKEQIIANLERQRWLEQEKPNKYIIVNIPQQKLWAVENGKVEHEMRVIVGKPQRKTMDFSTQVTGIRLNPTWTAPLSIKMKDILPEVQHDPEYLNNKGITVKTGAGRDTEIIDPHTVDWENMTWSEMNKLRFVQSPGNHNALGRYRVLMPNDYDIYLHDTNSPSLFERDYRALSSGCIRMSEPEKIAAFILEEKEDWSEDRTQNIIARGRMTDVKIDKPFPVYLVYQTIWQDENGELVYGADIYNRDRDLVEVLARSDAYKIPEAEKDTRIAEVSSGNQ